MIKAKYIIILFFLLVFLPSPTLAENIDNTYYRAQVIEDSSYLNFNCDTYCNVTVSGSELTGYAWSENYGWISLNCSNDNSCASSNFKISNNGNGTLSGYAWGENIGWINFGPHSGSSTSQVSISNAGDFRGYAWGENIGWISFSCNNNNSCATPTNGTNDWEVRTYWIPTSVSSGGDSGPGSTPDPTPDPIPDPTPDPTPTQGASSDGSSLETIPQPVLSELLLGQIKTSFETTIKAISFASQELKKIVNNPTGDAITKIVSTTGVVTGTTVSVASALFLNPISFSEIILIPARLWGLLMTVFGLKKRRRPWGTVYDSITKQPLDPAYVVLQDLEGKEINTSITDLDGRYGFLTTPGKYKILANKTNYNFPSKNLYGKIRDELYNDLYFNEEIEIKEDGEIINKNIPLDPINFDWNEFQKREQKLMKFYSRRSLFLARLSGTFFVIGFTVALLAAFLAPKTYNIIILGLYFVLLVVRQVGLKPKSQGGITSKDTGKPMPFAILRIFNTAMDTEIAHKVANQTGRYFCLVANGTYGIKVEKKNEDGSYSLVYTSELIKVTNGIINKMFEV
ncbi:hypothetical protein A2995_00135 [Candidatus Nomurabacteria bacterium RIFCSPLOWO2_01_FULL_33_24]|uniref:Carboxypeptidase regulatory-like domain-containing protein n=1 Tax=Candidatus Nomurabacteria bacterium RIFCSPLOWO2_01_FULL_33_24 TaxID=1801765 RepID=A0A1F6X210_9BACT|nr:MAG: hypothetical protein A2995_00135 [Candidatus Nomurabacteria bacterium RIFCSPLOWO2_01_FULL_33_24]